MRRVWRRREERDAKLCGDAGDIQGMTKQMSGSLGYGRTGEPGTTKG